MHSDFIIKNIYILQAVTNCGRVFLPDRVEKKLTSTSTSFPGLSYEDEALGTRLLQPFKLFIISYTFDLKRLENVLLWAFFLI